MVLVKKTLNYDYLDFYLYKNKRVTIGPAMIRIDTFLWYFSSKLLARQHVKNGNNKIIL